MLFNSIIAVMWVRQFHETEARQLKIRARPRQLGKARGDAEARQSENHVGLNVDLLN